MRRGGDPADLAAELERGGTAFGGRGERFTGYAVPGVAFESGDVLALRRFPISAGGPAYTSVWHCSPAGRWTFYTDVADHGCAAYFAPALDEVIVAPIRIEWTGPRSVSIAVDGGRLMTWSLLMKSTPVTRIVSACLSFLSRGALSHPGLLAPIGLTARAVLRTGPIRLSGRTPSGTQFSGCPWSVWAVRSSRACIGGHDTGPERPLDRPLALGDFRIPRRPLFAATWAQMTLD
jgi:hypothetical protein